MCERDTVEKVHEIASDPRVLERLVESVAPDLYGLKVVKEALLYFLLGGVSEERDGYRKRGNIHLLIVGDPGTGKSQLLIFTAEAASKSLMVTGNYTDMEGLVASITRDENGRSKVVPGALIQADKGILAIDKVDHLNKQGLAALVPVMAEQTLTFASDELMETFNARTSIIASGNPYLGRCARAKMTSDASWRCTTHTNKWWMTRSSRRIKTLYRSHGLLLPRDTATFRSKQYRGCRAPIP